MELSKEERERRRQTMLRTNAKRHGTKDDNHYRAFIKANTVISEKGCWEWQKFVHQKGYGFTSYRGKAWRSHRLAYHLFQGPIPPGMVICHTCDNRKCCNPLHLFLGTFDTNNKDMAAKGRCKYSVAAWPQCKHGHEFTPENTRKDSRGFRQCRTCEKIRFSSPEYKAWRLEYQRRRRAQKRLQLSEIDGNT